MTRNRDARSRCRAPHHTCSSWHGVGMGEAQPKPVRFRSHLLLQAVDDLARIIASGSTAPAQPDRRNCCASTLAITGSTSASSAGCS
jgi:hypothetical protein